MEPLRLVIRFLDGRMLKGTTNNFAPGGSTFHVLPANASSGSSPLAVDPSQLKAIFFVRAFDGKPRYQERKHFEATDRFSGRKVQIAFRDGEVMTGSVVEYNDKAPGFFLFPTDPQSNNQRIFVMNHAVTKLSYV